MANCLNCKIKLGCSCKKRTAADGTSCCATCLPRYEKTNTTASTSTTRNKIHTGVVLNVTAVEKK